MNNYAVLCCRVRDREVRVKRCGGMGRYGTAMVGKEGEI